MFEIVAGELHAKLNVDSAMRVRRLGMKWDWQQGLVDTTQHRRRRRCEGRRRDRRARAGFEIDHSERSSRVAISRAAGPSGARNTSGTTSTAGNQAISDSRAPSGSPTPSEARVWRSRGRPEIRRASSTAGDQAGNSTAGNQAISDSRAPSGSPTRKQHPPGQASAPNRRRRARDPRPRR